MSDEFVTIRRVGTFIGSSPTFQDIVYKTNPVLSSTTQKHDTRDICPRVSEDYC